MCASHLSELRRCQYKDLDCNVGGGDNQSKLLIVSGQVQIFVYSETADYK